MQPVNGIARTWMMPTNLPSLLTLKIRLLAHDARSQPLEFLPPRFRLLLLIDGLAFIISLALLLPRVDSHAKHAADTGTEGGVIPAEGLAGWRG